MSSAALASAPPVKAAGPLAVPGRVESTTRALVTVDGRQYLNFSGSIAAIANHTEHQLDRLLATLAPLL